MTKEEEFKSLYCKWYYSYCFSAFGSANPNSKEFYEDLKLWCNNNKDEAFIFIREMLMEEPSDIVRLLDDIWGKEYGVKVNGYVPLDAYCNIWLNILDHKDDVSGKPVKLIDYYKDYNKWQKHLKNNYIPWRPNLEDDPNVILEEFKQGKRNKKNMKHKYHNFPLSILKDDELEKLYKEGHLGNMTKYIEELHFFYNQVEEEVKRRKLKKLK